MKRVIFTTFIILLLPLLFQLYPLQILKLQTFDTFVEEQQPSGNFVVLSISEEDIEKEGGWPIPRSRLAQIHVDLLNAGALGVGWVVSFPQPDRFGGDEVFAEALSYGPTVLSMFEYNNGNYPPTTGTVLLGENISGIASSGVVENTSNLANLPQGISSAPVEVDNLVRRVPLLYQTPDGFVPSFGTEVLKMLAGAQTYIIKGDENGIQQITVQGLPPVDVDRLGRKWVSWVKTPETTLEEMNVAGKYVFVGVDAAGIMPQVATPVGLLEPHKIQAALSESILLKNSPYIPDWAIAAEILIFTIFVLTISLVLAYLNMTKGLAFGAIFLASTGVLGVFSIKNGILIDFSWTFVSEMIMSGVVFYMRFREQYKLRQQIKKQFEHYLDPRQVKRLQDNPDLLQLGGEKRYCTFLFTDVRGFTALSETLDPQEVTKIMNQALTIQTKAVQNFGGMVDKYIGDAMMAIFNAPIDQEDHQNRAIAAALQMQDEINKAKLEVRIGIGINTGKAVLGNMGSDSRFDYTAIGDAVNTAARLESATKEAGVELLIGQETAKNCKYVLKSLKPIKVKGKKDPLKIWTIDE
jgi:adenylate cyclase|tara:strand:- start:6626 stop:8365 length:1740 start_codon:yes stop_codon:yes gene_type:complete